MREEHGGWETPVGLVSSNFQKSIHVMFSVIWSQLWANPYSLAYAELKIQTTCLLCMRCFFLFRKLHELYSNKNDTQQWLKFHWGASDMLELLWFIAKYFSANARLLTCVRGRLLVSEAGALRSIRLQLARAPSGLAGKMPGAGESVTIPLCPGHWLARLQGTDFLASSGSSQGTGSRRVPWRNRETWLVRLPLGSEIK